MGARSSIPRTKFVWGGELELEKQKTHSQFKSKPIHQQIPSVVA